MKFFFICTLLLVHSFYTSAQTNYKDVLTGKWQAKKIRVFGAFYFDGTNDSLTLLGFSVKDLTKMYGADSTKKMIEQIKAKSKSALPATILSFTGNYSYESFSAGTRTGQGTYSFPSVPKGVNINLSKEEFLNYVKSFGYDGIAICVDNKTKGEILLKIRTVGSIQEISSISDKYEITFIK